MSIVPLDIAIEMNWILARQKNPQIENEVSLLRQKDNGAYRSKIEYFKLYDKHVGAVALQMRFLYSIGGEIYSRIPNEVFPGFYQELVHQRDPVKWPFLGQYQSQLSQEIEIAFKRNIDNAGQKSIQRNISPTLFSKFHINNLVVGLPSVVIENLRHLSSAVDIDQSKNTFTYPVEVDQDLDIPTDIRSSTPNHSSSSASFKQNIDADQAMFIFSSDETRYTEKADAFSLALNKYLSVVDNRKNELLENDVVTDGKNYARVYQSYCEGSAAASQLPENKDYASYCGPVKYIIIQAIISGTLIKSTNAVDIEVYGYPVALSVSKEGVTYQSETLADGDARCCPSQITTWVLGYDQNNLFYVKSKTVEPR